MLFRLLLRRGADIDARDKDSNNAEELAKHANNYDAANLLADVRRAGDWRGYVRYPRFRLLMLWILVGQSRAWTEDPLLRRLFPSPAIYFRTRAPRKAPTAKLPRDVLWHIIGYWRSSRDFRF